MSETQQCPCMQFDLDDGAKTANTCFCGDARNDHDKGGNCLVQHPVDAPYDPEMTRAALRMARKWLDS